MINWKPIDKKAAICFSIDDLFPGKSSDLYEAGGDLDKGVLRHLLWLTDRHPKLKITLFTTADWRETHPFPQLKILSKIPVLRDYIYLSKVLKKGTMSLVNHPSFVKFINSKEQFEVACHGLYHVHKGLQIPVEFQNQSKQEFEAIIDEMVNIFDASNINYVKGICPPGWNAPSQLMKVLKSADFKFIASSRDVFTEISQDATCNMSGLMDTSLIYPERLDSGLLHIPSNFQPNNNIDRMNAIIENKGLISIKGHIIKKIGNYVALDGIDESFVNYLDVLLTTIENKYGDDIWWTSMGEITAYTNSNN
jgi:hypothetical protein